MIPRERKWLIEKVILPIILALFALIVAIVTIIPTFVGEKKRFGDFLNIFTRRSTTRINMSNHALSTSFASPLPIEALKERIQSFAKAFPSCQARLASLRNRNKGLYN